MARRDEAPRQPELLPDELDNPLEMLTAAFAETQVVTPLEMDAFASYSAAAMRLAGADPAFTGRSALFDRPSPEEEAAIDEARSELVGVLAGRAGERADVQSILADALRCYGGPLTSHLGDARSDPADARHPLQHHIGQARADAASLVTFMPGDRAFVLLELSYPGDANGGDRAGVVVEIETFAGPRPVDAWICEDFDELLVDIGSDDVLTETADLAVDKALGMVGHGLWVLDHTLGGLDQLDDDADLVMMRPLLDHLLETQPVVEYETQEVTDLDRRRARKELVSWIGRVAPASSALAEGYATFLIDFAADNGGDPRRWSPAVAVEALHYASRKVVAPPDELAELPDLVRLAVRWSHEIKGWPDDLTIDTLEALDVVLPLYQQALGGGKAQPPGGDMLRALSFKALDSTVDEGLTVPPVGGRHPEPYDEASVPDGLRQRAAAIAEEASARAVEVFDAEFATLVRRLVADVASHPLTPLGRGKVGIWASAAIYAVAQVNKIPGGWGPLARSSSEITNRLTGSPASITTKAKALRDLVDIDTFPPTPRFQHSTSVAATGGLLTSMMALVSGMLPDGMDDLFWSAADDPIDGELVVPGSVDPASVGGECFVLRVQLLGIRPKIWRLLRAPVDATFADLHRLLQLAFGWYDQHLHVFQLGPVDVGPTGFDLDSTDVDEAELRLCDALGPGDDLVYEYDFGDSWQHRIVVEGVEDADTRRDELTGKPMGPWSILGGANAGPPEDCGGAPGYSELRKAINDKRHPRRAELLEWLPAGFNPKTFDGYTLNSVLQDQPWVDRRGPS